MILNEISVLDCLSVLCYYDVMKILLLLVITIVSTACTLPYRIVVLTRLSEHNVSAM